MIIYQKRIYRQDLVRNPDIMYIFGDNVERKGYGGQAKEMRGEPNAVGVATKWKPTQYADAFFTEEEALKQVSIIKQDLQPVKEHLEKGGIVIMPSDGLGTGLARLGESAPSTKRKLDQMIEYLSTL